MNIKIGDKVLVTTDEWFTAPDGRVYKCVFGTVKGLNNAKTTLGITVNARSSDWYLHIGNMVIAGCQIHYAIKTDKCNFERIKFKDSVEGKVYKEDWPTRIYNADEVAP